MSCFGLIEENMELTHIHLAVKNNVLKLNQILLIYEAKKKKSSKFIKIGHSASLDKSEPLQVHRILSGSFMG